MHDFVSDLHNYSAILQGIANNARTPKEISTQTGLPSGHIPKYLSVLVEAGFVERRISILDNTASSRNGRHHITDPYLRFYYRFLESRQYQFSLKIQEQAVAVITRHMIDFIGIHTWEELCREWVLRAGVARDLPFMPDQVGSAWTHGALAYQAEINKRAVSGVNWISAGMRLVDLEKVEADLRDWQDR